MLRTLLLSVAFAAFTFSATAQKSASNSLTKREIEDMTWVEAMQDYRVNFHTVVKKFDDAFEGKTYEKGHGWKQFKRWQHFMESRVDADGNRPHPSVLYQAIQKQKQSSTVEYGDWTPMGPFDAPSGGGIGRINNVAFHPQHNDTIYAGAPAGGLWVSYDDGQSWTTFTDELTNIGVSDLAIDPSNPNVMYLATGDRDAADTYSFGLLKSVDGGVTWNTTGLSFGLTNNYRIGRVVVDPDSTNIVYVATNGGVYRSTNSGANFTLEQAGQFFGIHKATGDTVYATTTGSAPKVYRSTDLGNTWSQLSTGLPATGKYRCELALSNTPGTLYVVYGDSQYGFGGLYKSTNGGTSWTLQSSTPNIMGWANNGTGTGGQAWYDLSIACDPNSENTIYVGGVNIWKSTNGGTSWSIVGHWYGAGATPYVHTDHHHAAFRPGTSELYVGTDGGVYKTANGGTSWTHLNDGMNITQYYKVSQSTTDSTMVVGGAQDNGSHLRGSSNWTEVTGGDGMDNGVDVTNDQTIYTSIYYGDFYKSTNGGAFFSSINTLSPAGTGNWVTPFNVDPVATNTVYAGFRQLWKSTNGGGSWTATSTSNVAGNQNIDEFEVAPSNTSYIYALINSNIYLSSNGGSTWNSVTPSGSLSPGANITGVAIDPDDEEHIAISISGYSASKKAMESFDAGSTWTNISTGLPNVPATAIIFEGGTSDGIYVGTDIGVYYKSSQYPNYVSYNKNLPNVIISDFEMYEDAAMLRIGTYGRGVWQSPLLAGLTSAPVANFTVDPGSTCGISDTVLFTDASSGTPTSWSWSVTPSTYSFVGGTNDSSQNPQMVFTAAGNYTVSLTVSNVYGTDDTTKFQVLSVGGATLPFVEDFESGLTGWEINNPDNGITWETSTVGGSSPGSTAMKIDFYSYSTSGGKDELISPALSFANDTNVVMTFEYASAYYPGYSDSLKVYVSSDCGTSWTEVAAYKTDESSFSTVGSLSSSFSPSTAANWCHGTSTVSCPSIDLNAYSGMSGVRVKFEAVNGYSNNLYLDNINITSGICGLIHTTDTITSCGPYTWIDGVTYTTSNYSATDTLVSASGCDSIVTLHLTVIGTWTQVGSDIDGEAIGDGLGESVSLSSDGSTVAIGAWLNDGNGTSAGHVRIYKNISGTWTQVGADIDGEASEDISGTAVSLSSDGSVVAIGAPYNDGNGSISGHVRIYGNISGTWTQVGADIDGESTYDYSGESVSLSSDGSTVAIGAGGNGSSAGHVRIYKNITGTWTQIGSDIDGEAAFDRSGSSVSLSGDGTSVAIGAWGNDGNGAEAGHVRIYKNIGGTWTQQGLDVDGEAAGDWYGWSVSLSSDGSTVAIGARHNDGNGADAGHVRVYKNVSSIWTQIGSDIDGEAAGDQSGRSVSLSSDGSTLAVGAWGNDGNGSGSGHVRIYKNISGSWARIGSDIDGEAGSDESGFSVSLSSNGSTVAIGAPHNDGNGADAGHVRVYNIQSSGVIHTTDTVTSCGPYTWIDGVTYTTSNYSATDTLVSASGCDSVVTLHLNIPSIWTQVGSDIDGEAAGDMSGESVSLSSDGSTVAIGAWVNDGNGTSAGHVRIYKNINGSWTQVGTDIDGEAAQDLSGKAVSLSSDGSVVAIGAPYNAGNGLVSGHVRIYKNISGSWTQIGSDIDGESPYDYSGKSVSLSSDGSIVAIGAPYNDGNGTSAGHVRIYKNITGTWTQVGSDIDGEAAGDMSGESVSLSSDGSIVAISAPYNDGNGTISGHVRIYKNINGSWTQVGSDIDGEAALDECGESVSLSSDGSTVAIGAWRNDGNGTSAGHVRIYKNINGSWTQVGTDIDGEAADDRSGKAVSLSSDGSVVAIGAPNDGNSSISGHVRIYRNISGTWTQVGADIDGEAADDRSGSSVSLSGDGSTVAIGAIHNDGNGPSAGHVRVYNIESSSATYATDTITSCGPYTWIDGNTYTASNDTATYTLTNAAGCDSVVTLDLTINSSNTGTDVITACDSFTWIDGNTYTASNDTATYTLTNAAGCDSVVTLDLTINSSNTGTDVITACDSYTWIDGNSYTTSNNTVTYTLTNAVGCDSVVTLNLTINSSNTGTDVITACDSYTWIDGNTYNASNNTATYTLTNAAGCDSVVTLNLTINSSNTGTDVITACDSYTWIDGNTYTTSNNTATHTLTNAAGCDSVVTLDVTITYSNTVQVSLIGCDQVSLNGQTYTVSGNYIQNLVNSDGCDSILTINANITYGNFIQTQPTNQSVGEGLNAVFFIVGPPTAQYQWQTNLGLGFQDLNDFGQYSGTTTSSLQVSNVNLLVNNNQAFRCFVTEGNCTDTSVTVVLEVVPSSSVNELEQGISIYPNPTQGLVKLELYNSSSTNDIYQLQLVDSHGKMIQESHVNFQDGFIVINLEDYPAGMYQLTLKNQHEVFNEKISLVK